MTNPCEVQFRVRYHETDQMGIVYHANYLNWFEVGRTEWLRNAGFTYRKIEDSGLILPVTEVKCKYYVSAKYDDIVKTVTRIKSCNKVRLTFSYEIYRVQNELNEQGIPQNPTELLVTGETEHVFLNENHHVMRMDKARPDLYELIIRSLE